MVVAAHSFCLIQRMSGDATVASFMAIFDRYIINLGPIGVELFFVLSGFLIGGILVKIYTATSYTFADVRQFWVRRWFRTLPNYWLILSVNLLIVRYVRGFPIDSNYYWGYLFMQNLIHPDSLNVFPEGWSLSVEEWFYLTLPVTLFVTNAIFKPTNKGLFLIRAFIGYLSFFLLLRILNAFNPINGVDPDDGIRKVVLFRLDAVMYGVLVAWLAHFKKEWLTCVKKSMLLISLVGSVVLYFFIVKYELAFRSQPQPVFRFISNAFLYMVIPLVFALSLPYAADVKDFSNRYVSAVVRHISKISYSLYLVHFSLFIPWFIATKPASVQAGLAWYLAYWVVVITASSLLYRLFEQPVMRIRDRFSNHN